MSRQLLISLTFLFCLVSVTAYSQVNDAGLWLNIELQKKISRLVTLKLSEELRLNENITEAGTLFTETGPEIKLTRNFDLGIYYRFVQKRRVDDSYSTRHRLMTDLSYKYKWQKWTLGIRGRYQVQYKDIYSSEKGRIPEHMLRGKVSLKYRLHDKITPFVSTELFYALIGPGENIINDLRYSGGFEYEWNKKYSLDICYLINREYNVNNPFTDYVIGLSYMFKLQ